MHGRPLLLWLRNDVKQLQVAVILGVRMGFVRSWEVFGMGTPKRSAHAVKSASWHAV